MNQLQDLAAVAHQSKASQDTFEMFQLMTMVARVNPSVIVEIGVHKGYSLETWDKAFKPDILIGIDNDAKIDPLLYEHGLDTLVMEMDSHDPATVAALYERLEGRSIDFLFIDGDHTYEGAKDDFNMYAPLVSSGGIVGFHDTMRVGEKWLGKIEVRRLFDELRQEYPSAEFWNGKLGEGGPGTGVLFL